MEELKDLDSASSISSYFDSSSPSSSPRRGAATALRSRILNPLRFLPNRFSYQRIPSLSIEHLGTSQITFRGLAHRLPTRDGFSWRESRWKWPCGKLSSTRLIIFTIIGGLLFLVLVGGGRYHTMRKSSVQTEQDGPQTYYWMYYQALNGYFNGVRTLVPTSRYTPENGFNRSLPLALDPSVQHLQGPPLKPEPYIPYPDFSSPAYLRGHREVQTCFLDEAETMPAPDIYAYPGLPQHMSEPFFGSYDELGLESGKCFDRFGRLAPYGYGYDVARGGLGVGTQSEHAGSAAVFDQAGFINYTYMDWGAAQRRCVEKNKARFDDHSTIRMAKVSRQAYVLRTWTGYKYSEYQILTLRAMISELSLKSSGEYDVHLLVHVKDDSIPIWASQEIYNRTLEANVPREFWGISTLWSESLMRTYYPGPFTPNFANMISDNVHAVYRGAHFALQWFSQQHPEYEHFWNWEMDLRYSGHYWEFNNAIGEWAKRQPRKGLWERNRRFWIPRYHGDYEAFSRFVEDETMEKDVAENDLEQSGPVPVWGPANSFPNSGMLNASRETLPSSSYHADEHKWGVGEDADLLTFNPIFDPSRTNWVFRNDATGYDTSHPIPPRRAAIITVARLSRRLLDKMHEETWRQRHHMFPEMWPPSVAFHHGLKAVYVPHPVYFDHDWDLDHMNQVFNYPETPVQSPFGWGENNMYGGTFYYANSFSSLLWRRWLGQMEMGQGGRQQEEAGTGRMCLRGTLHHPVKHEASPLE